MDQRRVIISVVILTFAAISGAGLVIFGSGGEHRSVEESTSSEWAELEAILEELKYTWKPSRRAKILRAAEESLDQLRTPVLDLLATVSHPLLKEAIELASTLEVTEAHPAFVRIARSGPENARPVAILAAEEFEPWDVEDVRGFLKEGTKPVLLAALELPSSRDNQLAIEIIQLLGHEDPEVRRASGKAIPEAPGPEYLEELLAVGRNATEEQAISAIRALSRTTFSAKVEVFMIQQMNSEEQSIRIAALDAMTAKGSRLRYPTVVWRFAREAHGGLREKAKAILCLERTRSFASLEIREAIPDLHPYLWYFAARCLISAGEREGVGILIDLLEFEEGQFGELEDVDFGEMLYAARKLMAELSNIPPSVDKQRWQRWYADLRVLEPQPLLPPSLNL